MPLPLSVSGQLLPCSCLHSQLGGRGRSRTLDLFPKGMFPEGWTIYGFLGVYAVLGATLAVVLGKVSRKPTSSSDTQHELPSTAFAKFRNVIVLSLPAIVGTGVFLAGVILSKLDDFNGAPPISWGEPSGPDRLRIAVVFYFACYFGAAFGPLLLPLAGQQAFALTRAVGLRSTIAIWAWTFVVGGLVAMAVFWGWLIHLDIFI